MSFVIFQLKEVRWTFSVHSMSVILATSAFPLEHPSYLSKRERLTLINEEVKGKRLKD